MNYSVEKKSEPALAPDGKRTIVTLKGEFDLTNASAVAHVLDDVSFPATLDLSGVRYVDSSMLTELVRFARRIAPQQATIVGLQPQIRRIFDVVHFGRLFVLQESPHVSIVPTISEDSADLDPAS